MKIDKYVNICLLILILFGLYTGCHQALADPITSDLVNPGLYAQGFWQGNQQFYVPVNDPYIIDYAISLITVPLSGYSARGLFIQGLIVYFIIVLLAFLIARHLAGDTAGLLAAALVANAPLQSLQYLVAPLYHGTTIMLVLASIYAYLRLSGNLRFAVITILLAAGALNDTLIVPLFIAPLLVINIVKYRGKDSLAMIIASLIGVLVFIVKDGELWPGGLTLVSVGGIGNIIGLTPQFDMIPAYMVALVISGGLMVIIPLIAALYYAWKNPGSRFYVALTGLSALFMLGGFVFMHSSGGDLARWLYPIPVMGLLAVSIGIKNKATLAAYIIPVLAILLIINNATAIATQTPDINQKDAALIDFLHEKNISHAYADYWVSNLLTYLDDEKRLDIIPAHPVDGRLQFLYLQSSQKWLERGWADNDTMPVLITYSPGDPMHQWALEINRVYPPVEVFVYEDYMVPGLENMTITIYKYNTTLPAWPAESFEDFRARGIKTV